MKKRILKTIAIIMGFIFMVSASALDSLTWIPTIMTVVSGLWLVLYAYANGAFDYLKEEGDC